jgi:hypothetical protein
MKKVHCTQVWIYHNEAPLYNYYGLTKNSEKEEKKKEG